MRALLLDVGGRDNLSGEVQPFTEVVKTLGIVRMVFSLLCDNGETYLGGEGVVVVLPRELGLDVATGVERLAGLDHVEVLGVNVAVLGKVEVLLGHEHTLYSFQVSDYPLLRIIDSCCSRRITVYKPSKQRRAKRLGDSSVVHIPRKRYSWIFLRSSLGISLGHCQFFFSFQISIGIIIETLTLSRVPGAIRGIAQTTSGKVVCLNDRNDQSGAGTSREKCDVSRFGALARVGALSHDFN